LLQENPSEEDAAIVDKVLSMRVVKKEVGLLSLIAANNAVFTGFIYFLFI
jgi:hypothetical protein